MGEHYKFLGSAYILMGVIMLIPLFQTAVGKSSDMSIAEGIIAVIIFILLGWLHLVWAKKISQNKYSKQLIELLEKQGLDKQIANSSDFAAEIYQKCPTKKMKKYIDKKCASKSIK